MRNPVIRHCAARRNRGRKLVDSRIRGDEERLDMEVWSLTPTANSRAPLAGYRVLELGSTVAGPFCGRLFADFGAEVIKVEPREGDPVRSMGRRFNGKSLYAAEIFRNKALISVDLRKPQ